MRQKEVKAAKPLAGKRMVITRARAQAASLARRIEESGGIVIEFPTIEIQPPESFAAFDDAVRKVEDYDWLIFTSVNGVEPFFARLGIHGKAAESIARIKVGAIGPETAKRLEEFDVHASLVPERYQAEGILDAMAPETMRGKKVLIPRAASAREILPQTLRGWGASVDVVVAYRTVLPEIDISPLAKLLREDKIDVVTFTSSSTVKNFVRLFGDTKLSEIVSGSAIACIGPITARSVELLGGRADIVAREYTISGLLDAIVEYLQTRPDATVQRSGGPAI
jgi:uroporphyrinogen III methyltransferase/synthase